MVDIEGYILLTWDTNTTDTNGKCILGYRFSKGSTDIIFEGEDFHCSPVVAIDSDDALRGILTFLTLRPGDTDKDYFDNYTSRQWDFVHSDAESISLYALEPDDDFEAPIFRDMEERS
jgi:hypothetical protein